MASINSILFNILYIYGPSLKCGWPPITMQFSHLANAVSRPAQDSHGVGAGVGAGGPKQLAITTCLENLMKFCVMKLFDVQDLI